MEEMYENSELNVWMDEVLNQDEAKGPTCQGLPHADLSDTL